MNPSRNPDPLGYMDEVRHSLRRLGTFVDLTSPDTRSAAFGVVVNLGFCRLHGIEIPSDVRAQLEAALSDDVMVAAACEFVRVLRIWRDDAGSLPNRFDEAEPFEDRSICTGALHQRTEAWAAFVAIDETYQLRVDDGIASKELDSAVDRVLDDLKALDDVLTQEDRLRLLAVATELPLLENSRQMLAAPFDELLPWWLDGTLEAIAQGTVRETAFENADLLEPDAAPPPHAVSLLLRRTQEIAAQAAEFRIAASAGGRVGPAADELLESTYPVEGDDAVKVRFSIEPGSNCRHQFRIVLVAPMPALERYRSAAIKFNDGSVCSMALGLGAGGVELSVDEITVVTSLMLVEESGERRHVDINACHE